MSDPPEVPPAYHEPLTGVPASRTSGRSLVAGSRPRVLLFSCSTVAVIALVAGFLFYLLSLFSGPDRKSSAADASSTSEAQTFATAQVYRQTTRDAASGQSTALALSTALAQAEASRTALAYAHKTAITAALATVHAPPTLTARARDFQQEEANAHSTAQAVDPASVKVYGPSSGILAHNTSSTAVCDDTGVQLRNFAAEARFYNPYPIDHDWDYGIVLTNPSDGSQYNVVLDADSNRSFRLQGPSYYVQDLDTSHLIDNSDRGSNLLKLYAVGGVLHLYINGHFETTLDLASLYFGTVRDEPHDIKICTGLIEGDMQPGKSTRYEDFTVWKLP